MRSLADWLDERLQFRGPLRQLRGRVLPDGPSWWFTSASCLLWMLVIECITGLLLMATYSPSMSSAWASVWFIDQSAAGRFLRGVHHYTSHTLIFLFAVHVARVLVMGAYRAPRELIWITGLLLFPLIIVWTVTGNPLAASQKGVAQIQVEANILASTPGVGPFLRRLLLGGEDVGNLTLTRLYFLHVGLLPLLVGSLSWLHLQQVIRHSTYQSLDSIDDPTGAVPYWPYQSVRNLIVLSLVLGSVAALAWWEGAPLPAPADPDLPLTPRPEWYFRWLFELRRYFTGDWEFVATMVVPSAFLGVFLAAPFLDRVLPHSSRLATIGRVGLLAVAAGTWSWLTYVSFARDAQDAEYLAATAEFDQLSTRALQLARTQPITTNGAIELLRNDPQTQGPRLFRQHCASCHAWTDPAGVGIAAAQPSAPNLWGVGQVDWILGFLDAERLADVQHFGQTAFREGTMLDHLKSLREKAGEAGRATLDEQLRLVAEALAAEAQVTGPPAEQAQANIARGKELLVGDLGCIDCHRFHAQGELGSAPDLTGYASAGWLRALIAQPAAPQFYADRNDRMPGFATDPEHPAWNMLSPHELEMLVQWLRTPVSSTPSARK